MSRVVLLICFFVLAYASVIVGDEYYLLVGGGPSPEASQISIEENVDWIQGLLDEYDFSSGQVFFGAGDSVVDDVVYEGSAEDDWLEPIVRLAGGARGRRHILRHNEIAGNLGAATDANVVDALGELTANLREGDGLFFIFSGHGSWESDKTENSLRLWGESRLSAKEFSSILKEAPSGSHVRYVLPQCYSGAFLRSVFQTPEDSTSAGLLPQHCGFVSVSESTISEGCTVAVENRNYRDYATYFFAALSGATRDGRAIDDQTDMNGDGQVSLLEAHYYAFIVAQSADVPRTTSEYFLELTVPWYSRWLASTVIDNANPYVLVAGKLEERLHLSDKTSGGLLLSRKKLEESILERKIQLEKLLEQEQSLRDLILTGFVEEFQVNESRLSMIISLDGNEETVREEAHWIGTHVRYGDLKLIQAEVMKAETQILDMRREAAQLEKLQRARRLASLYQSFSIYGSHADRLRFDQLRQCESWVLPQ